MVAATFRHLASRNLDPQLHTHAVLANMTRGPDGSWRSLDTGRLHAQKHLIGAHYRNELARRLRDMGYDLTPTMIGHVPGFEISGWEKETLDAFSTRRREIVEHIEEKGWDYDAAKAQVAALADAAAQERTPPGGADGHVARACPGSRRRSRPASPAAPGAKDGAVALCPGGGGADGGAPRGAPVRLRGRRSRGGRARPRAGRPQSRRDPRRHRPAAPGRPPRRCDPLAGRSLPGDGPGAEGRARGRHRHAGEGRDHCEPWWSGVEASRRVWRQPA